MSCSASRAAATSMWFLDFLKVDWDEWNQLPVCVACVLQGLALKHPVLIKAYFEGWIIPQLCCFGSGCYGTHPDASSLPVFSFGLLSVGVCFVQFVVRGLSMLHCSLVFLSLPWQSKQMTAPPWAWTSLPVKKSFFPSFHCQVEDCSIIEVLLIIVK